VACATNVIRGGVVHTMHHPLLVALATTLALAIPADATRAAPPSAAPAAAVVTDPPHDAAHPARFETPAIPSPAGAPSAARMNSVFYLAAGAGPHPTVLLLRYRGAWGSQGAFSFTHAEEDVVAALAFLRDGANARRYGIDTTRIVLVGHSMGGFMAAWAAAHDPRIPGIAMISAWNIGGEVLRLPKDAGHQRQYVADLGDGIDVSLAGCTAEALSAEAHAHAREWDFTQWAPALQPRPVLFVTSDDGNAPDSVALAACLRRLGDARVSEVHVATDHSYSDNRIALASVVVRWLQTTRF